MFEEVLIPEAVYRELTTNALFENEAKIVKTSSFLKTSSVQNRKSLQLLQAVSGLDDGESEAIILADELNMDERKGRKVAEKLGIKITGTVGVLLQSYSENMISSDEIKTYLDQLKNSNIRLSESLIQKTLEML